jgi:glycerate 2-kinase
VLAPGVTLAALQRENDAGIASGIAIAELNANRRRLSRIKGGRLTAQLAGRPALAFFISDVPGDDPAVIGSGLLGPAAEGADHVERRVIASIDHAVAAAGELAQGRGSPCAWQLSALTAMRAVSPCASRTSSICTPKEFIFGVASRWCACPHPGHGGRNQHLALAAARGIAGRRDLLLLAAGTDGTDGVSLDAGALVDGETCARIALAEIDVEDCLKRADSGTRSRAPAISFTPVPRARMSGTS